MVFGCDGNLYPNDKWCALAIDFTEPMRKVLLMGDDNF